MLNKAMLIGRLGRDPEMRYTPTGKAVTTFSVAVDERHGEERTTLWLAVECWEDLAERVAEYARKGTLVYVEGRLAIDEWEDKATKAKRTRAKIRAANVQFLSPKRSESEPKLEVEALPF